LDDGNAHACVEHVYGQAGAGPLLMVASAGPGFKPAEENSREEEPCFPTGVRFREVKGGFPEGMVPG